MDTEKIRNILQDIYDTIKSLEIAQVDKSTNWQIDDKADDLESEY